MRGIESYRLRTAAFPLGVVLYVIVAVLPPPAGSLEVFPFFRWSLFTYTSDSRTDVVAIIRSIDGKDLDSPTLVYDLKSTFRVAANKDTQLAKSLDRLAYAIRAGDEKMEERIRRLIENRYLNEVESMEYDIAIIAYDPLVRYRTGDYRNSIILRSYSKND